MAERRMFAKTIIDSDAFLDMSASAQSLYFHLGMRADDDGFVNNPKKIQKIVGAADDDLKILIAKRFVLVFDSGVLVIKHWRMHNYIRADRYKETHYIKEKSLLQLKDNGAYTEALVNQMTTIGQPNDNQRLPQVRLGKDSIVSSKGADAPTPTKTAFGEYGWIKLTDAQHNKFIADFGESEFNRCVAHIDESAQSTGNKNKWKDWNLVLRRCHRDGWGLKVDKFGEPVKVSNRKEKVLSD